MSNSFLSCWTMGFNMLKIFQAIVNPVRYSKMRTNGICIYYKIQFIELVYAIGFREAENPLIFQSMNLDVFAVPTQYGSSGSSMESY